MRAMLFASLFCLLLAGPLAARELPGTCRVTFGVSATLHGFDGSAACMPFVLTVSGTAEEERLEEATLTVTVAGMQTGIERRDRTMRAMFQAGDYPHITGRLRGAPLAELRRQLHAAAESGQPFELLLTIRSIERPVAVTASNLIDTPREFSVDLAFPVSLAAFELQPPVVLGFLRVADEVRVRVGLHLVPLPTPWTP